MTTSPVLGATDLVASQAIPETSENERGRRFEQGGQYFNVADKDLAAPPASPADGVAYIVAASPTGAWAGQAKSIAYYQTGTGWLFITPRTGFRAYAQDEDLDYRYVSGAWAAATGTGGATLDTDGTLAANSDTRIPSQKAVKTFVSAQVAGLLDFKGSTDCSANPNYPAALKGDAYIVSVAGKIGGASGTAVDAGDIYIASADNAGGTQAAVGASWFSLEHNGVFATGTGNLLIANNLSDLASAATARTNLGVRAATPSVPSVASAATVTPTFADDQVNVTAQAAALALANPTGSAVDAWGISIRIKDNGTARAISYGTQYRAIGVTLPSTTVISKTLYLGMIFNAADTKWDVVAVAQEA